MDRSRLIISASIALAVYFLLDLVDPYIALPLRVSSARISVVVLNAISIPVSRDGTILYTPNFRMDVEPACSGSTTLRILMTACVIWCFIHPGLTPWRRVLCILLGIPVALVANGFRVAALVGGGDVLLKPVEGIPHYAIGVLAFIVAMGTVYLTTWALSVRDVSRAAQRSQAPAWLGLALVILYLPVGVWIAGNWTSVNAEWEGAVFFVLSGLAAFRLTRGRWGEAPAKPILGLLAYGVAVAAYVGACFVDVRTLQAWSMLLGVLALAYTFGGLRPTLILAPCLVAFGMGFPMTSHVLNTGLERFVGTQLGALALAVRAATAIGCLLVAVYLSRRLLLPTAGASAPPAGTSIRPVPYVALLTVLGILGQGYLYNQATDADTSVRLELSYLQGEWVGEDNPVSEVAAAVIGRQRITTRRYTKANQWVEIIVTSTGADRRRAHPPEACMQGVGWTAVRNSLVPKTVSGRQVEVSYFRFRREDREVDFVYWFTDGERTYPTYNQMLNEDLLRRAKGNRTNWFLVRVISAADSPALGDFLQTFSGRIVRDERAGRG